MRSILFVKELYEATAIAQNKTETRRTHGLQTINEWPNRYVLSQTWFHLDRLCVTFQDAYSSYLNKNSLIIVKSRFKKNEILYLAEPMFIKKDDRAGLTPLEIDHHYAWNWSDGICTPTGMKKISPLLMRQEYGRHFIKISDVSIERVQEISDEAVIREGIKPTSTGMKPGTLQTIYATLFDKVNKPGTWDKNPFVFVYRYEYLKNYKRRLQNVEA